MTIRARRRVLGAEDAGDADVVAVASRSCASDASEMSDSKKNEKSMMRAAVDTGVTTGVALGSAALVGTGTTGFIVAGASAAVPGVLSMLADWNGQRRSKRWAKWIAAYVAADENIDAEEVEAHLHANASDPFVQATILEGARAVDEALADEVVPVLARLTRTYVSSGSKADAFFRGTRRMLSDLSDDEVRALTAMVQRVIRLGVVGQVGEVRLMHDKPVGAPVLECTWLVEGEDGKREYRERLNLGHLPHALRLFHLFKVNDLGFDSSAGSFGASSGPGIVHVPVDTFAKLWPLLG